MDKNKKYYKTLKEELLELTINTDFNLEQLFCSCMECKEDCLNYGKNLDIITHKEIILKFTFGTIKIIPKEFIWIENGKT